MGRRTLIWLAVAPLGIGLTTGLTITTTLLTQQPIGLASEPLSAGDALAPRLTKAASDGIRVHAAHPPPALVAHGGHAVAIAVSSTPLVSVTPPVAPPIPPPPAPPPPPTTTTPVPAKQPAKQPTHTTPTQTKAPADDHGGDDPQSSSDDSGSDNSGRGKRDD